MHKLKTTLISFALLISLSGLSQIKDEFEKVRREEEEKKVFATKLLSLDSTARKGFDSLISRKDSVDFLSIDTVQQKAVILFELPQSLYEVFNELKAKGKIPNLVKLRQQGQLKVMARGIANEIELPKKNNPNQSYSDFYLKMLQKLIDKNKTALAQDELNYTVYQSWENEASLHSEKDLAAFRYAFIIFLYKKYNL